MKKSGPHCPTRTGNICLEMNEIPIILTNVNDDENSLRLSSNRSDTVGYRRCLARKWKKHDGRVELNF